MIASRSMGSAAGFLAVASFAKAGSSIYVLVCELSCAVLPSASLSVRPYPAKQWAIRVGQQQL